MPYPYSPLELAALNPHGLDRGDRVFLPGCDGSETIIKRGHKWAVLTGPHPYIPLAQLRPYTEPPRIVQLSFIDLELRS